MARGLLFGAFFFYSAALVSVVMILWPDSPWSTWLMEKTELGDDFCWFGEGIWRTNLVWGESRKGLHCPTHGLREMDAMDAYCLSDDPSVAMFSSQPTMCEVTKWGRFFTSFGAVLSFLGAILVVAVHFTTSLATRNLRAMRALAVMAISFISHVILFILVAASPLFDSFHFHFLGRRNSVNYKGLGCVFQSPFVGGLKSLLTSSPLKCLYPGPAFPLTIGVIVFQFMGCLLLGLLVLDTRKRMNTDLDATINASSKDSAECYYSLHGALMRRLKRFHRLEQNLAGVLIPMFVIGKGMLLVSWFYHGMQFLVHVHVHNEKREHAGEPWFPMSELTIVELREQVFTFDPVTTLTIFWEGHGYLLTLITSFWLDFFPFLKIFLWLFYWFVPQSEVVRGRVFTWIDYLGRWSLANLFCLAIISVAFLFQSKLFVPIPLPNKQIIAIELECVIESGAGVTWFILSMLWTIALGDIMLQLHTIARNWEEERRKGSSNAPGVGLPLLAEERIDEEGRLLPVVPAFEDDTPVPTPLPPVQDQSSLNNTGSSAHGTPTSLGNSGSGGPGGGGGMRRASLFRELVRRTSTQFLMVSPASGPKEALCNESFAPINNQKHKFSSKGIFAVWSALIIILMLILAGLVHEPFIKLYRSGAVPDLLLNEIDSSLTVLSLVNKINMLGGSMRPAYELAIAFVLFAFIFPLLHSLALMFMWGYPMSVKRQQQLFRFIEFCDAWNALDVFFIAGIIVWIGVETISKSVVEIVVPGLTAAARELLGKSDVYVISPEIKNGFWYILVGLIGQKIVSHVLMELAAATIAQRQYTLDRAEVEATPSGISSRIVYRPQQMLSPHQLLMFSPAVRYVGVSGVNAAHIVYAGLPRWIWRGGVAAGLMVMEDD